MSENRRYDELKTMLQERRRELTDEVREKIRENRNQNARRQGSDGALEVLENSALSVQEDIELTLIEMKASMLAKINDALARIEDGSYSYCFNCGGQIAEKRLHALPFAVRCKDCEEAREVAEQCKQTRRREVAFGLFAQDDL